MPIIGTHLSIEYVQNKYIIKVLYIYLTEPDPPTNVVLMQISNRRVKATWTPPNSYSGANYRIYVNTGVVNRGGTPVSGNTFVSESLPSRFITYIVRVRATTGTYLSRPAVSSTFRILGTIKSAHIINKSKLEFKP